jgi:CheY-like chemotaxis protein/HPt (histidine-containing phosphotransfer) domain-containing protein
MVGAPSAREEEQARLTGARGEFVASLPRRLEVLRAALSALEEEPSEGKRQHGMLRRIHALGSAARVLGFATVAEVLAEAERAVRRASRPGNQALAFQDVARALDLLPALVLGGAPAAPRPLGEDAEARAAERAYPLSVLLFGASALGDALRGEVADRVEIERTEDLARAREIARTLAPDVAVVDADRRDARDLVEHLLSDPQIERVPLLVIGAFVSPEAATAYVTLGAERVLPKPVSPETLRRTVLELHELASRPRTTREPVGELTVDGLADRIMQEVRKGLVESVEVGGQSTPVDFADGADVLAAVWGAVARVRELVTVRSRGGVRFQPFGPEGAIPLAPFPNDRRAGDRTGRYARGAEDVSLRGRRILVADDDPAVVWFMSGLFKAVGADVLEAHDGTRALELVFDTAPDLVVSDVLMPGRDGFALCHEIKRDVVARDIPVILLSWKEDLLQRVRELGADADGYLRKEAAASTVVERVREVLRPRARVEQRLASGGEARGRLDGLTPRFVLERVCKSSPDATLTVRDAVYLYEIHVRGGRVRTATRTAADGNFERGERVLAALLGVSAGRFSVQPDVTSCRNDFQDPLDVLLRKHVERARAALAALSAERLGRVLRVQIERESVGGYLECSPEWARRLIDQLVSGRAPREILLAGEVAPRLLEWVLSDLARRGAILGVERDDAAPIGLDPLQPDRSTNPPAGPPANPPATGTTVLETRFQSSPAPGRSTQAAAEDFSEAKLLAETVQPPVAAPGASVGESRALEPAEDPANESDDAAWFGFQMESSTAGNLPPVAPVPQVTAVPGVALAAPGVPTPAAPAATAPAPESEAEAKSAPERISATEGLSAESLSVFQAITAGPAPVAPKAKEPSQEPIPDIVPASDDLDLSAIHKTLGGLGPAYEVGSAAPPREHEPTRPLNQTLPLGTNAPHSGPRPTSRAASESPPPGMADAIVAADRVSEPAIRTPPTVEAPRDPADPPLNEELSAATVIEGRSPFLEDTAESPEPGESSERSDRGVAPLEATLVSEGAPHGPARADSGRDLTPAVRAPVVIPSSTPISKPRSDPRPEPLPADGTGVWRTAALALLAFAAAFALVRYALVPMLQPKENLDVGSSLPSSVPSANVGSNP